MRDLDKLGLIGIVLAIGYTGYVHFKLNKTSEIIGDSIDEISDNVKVNIQDEIVNKAVQKAVEKAIEAGYGTQDIVKENALSTSQFGEKIAEGV